jgi:hypothetical protein
LAIGKCADKQIKKIAARPAFDGSRLGSNGSAFWTDLFVHISYRLYISIISLLRLAGGLVSFGASFIDEY